MILICRRLLVPSGLLGIRSVNAFLTHGTTGLVRLKAGIVSSPYDARFYPQHLTCSIPNTKPRLSWRIKSIYYNQNLGL